MEKLVAKHSGWVHLSMGQVIRDEVEQGGSEERWRAVRDMVLHKKMVPQVGVYL